MARGTCKKVRYGSKGEALSASDGDRRCGKKKPVRPYYCVGCKGWHLAVQPAR